MRFLYLGYAPFFRYYRALFTLRTCLPPYYLLQKAPRKIASFSSRTMTRWPLAIGSALKKFAPEHVAQIARSLVEAEGLAAETEPSLFVLDFDPPHAGDIAFLSKMKGLYPNARVLVLVAANMREIGSEIGSTGALHFIEKPFELAGFGASVQALLGPWAATASDKVRGTLRDLCLMDVLQLKCSTGATELVEVQAPGGRVGEIHFRDGRICHAEAQNSSGSPALETMLRWQGAHFAEAELPLEGPKTISLPWKIVLLDALRKVREIEELTELLEPKKPKPVHKKPKPAKKIVVIDDTEMLLIFVEDILTSKSQDLDIITASAGGEGVSRVEKHLPDLVLLDYSLPDINGDEVCQRLLANEKTARIPIVMMSGHVLEMNEAAARYENIVATIAKPFLSISRRPCAKDFSRRKGSRLAEPTACSGIRNSKFCFTRWSSCRVCGPGNEKHVGSVAPRPPIPPPLEITAVPARISVAPPATSPLSASENEVVLGFPLEVTSMQLTPLLKIGSLRASLRAWRSLCGSDQVWFVNRDH